MTPCLQVQRIDDKFTWSNIILPGVVFSSHSRCEENHWLQTSIFWLLHALFNFLLPWFLFTCSRSPTLKTLDLDAVLLFKQSTIIPKLISKWKNLEMLTLGSRRNMVEILSQISLHCNNFIKLFAPGIYVGKDEVTAMITLLPNLKYLDLKGSTIEQKNLVMILQGCKELQLLDVRDCIGFWEGNAEILELASHIPKFMCEGSIYEEYDTYIDGDVDSDYYSG